MANLPESSTWESVYQIELTDPVQGGPSGLTNTPLKNLTNRTKYLKDHVDALEDANLDDRVTDLETENATQGDNISTLLMAMGAATGVRHGIVACKHGTGSDTGRPTFLDTSTIGSTSGTVVIQASVSEPFVGSMCIGYGASGPEVRYGRVTSNVTLNYSTSTDQLLLAQVMGDGTITFELVNNWPVFVSYAPPLTPSNGSYWFNLSDEKMYLRSGGSWVQRNRIVIAIISPGAGSIIYYPTIRRGAKDLYGLNDVPVGTIHTFAGTAATVPQGYLLCDGGQVSRTIYSHLFQAIGTTYGAGNGSTTFSIPDLRGEFLRGLDNGRGIDPGRALGSAQGESVNTAGVQLREANLTWATTGGGIGQSVAYFENSNIAAYGTNMTLLGGNETRPRNVAMNFIIKF